MYAIVSIAGQQFKVEENQEIYVHHQNGNEGDSLTFNEVLLMDNDGKVVVGTPTLPDASVSATIVSHVKGDKVIIFKKKRRKGYQVMNGHRQSFTKLKIDKIK
ncbi:MAG: 50S ribosomal protein L21 [Chitinophagales bacterium]|nr:50S ribosomal protein L21 [Saprospiraceae bacterium]MBK7110040.1 50S ribosomal protein L21 [Bacteroidota bacterium]MBP7399708.1 50S ribosomal protein L21 [Chitinophagales bacterium]MBK8487236.1 50S ribosomal protein L21 [Bacteroidota bacterium]MBK8680622.1 50S ribosomal protein L21 [Bacteroidota bacterium]